MRLTISGDYPTDWVVISLQARASVSFRCVRCRHPFHLDGRPMACDDQCDATRGRLLRGTATGDYQPWGPHDWVAPGLNYGVHHFDGNKSNCRWWNLMPMCNSCHLTIQARVIPERSWLFDHSEWARPYIGGFYAFWFAGREEPRARVVALQRFFLAVGQPWLYPDLTDAVRRYIAREDSNGPALGRHFGEDQWRERQEIVGDAEEADALRELDDLDASMG